ncbi:MAG: N-acetylglucosamine-6-phosphate deacetylase [Anaerolineales bacterium]|nr:N-acetylglucosamine-6-phosphate deacetylase [Anaerolineales bacterium]
MKTYITHGTIITPEKCLEMGTVIIEAGKIVEFSSSQIPANNSSNQIDATGLYVCPGFIDIHFHGALGCDAMDASYQSLEVCSKYCAEHGVTSFYPTTWSASAEDIFAAIENVKQNQYLVSGAQIIGVHVEGPYLDVQYRGAQLPSMIRLPDPLEYEAWFNSGVVKNITVAPEVEGALELIKKATMQGIRISIGHTQASYEQVIEAANFGANQATHIFNGMPALHHREPGTVGGVLDDRRIYAQLICDGVHLHPATVRLVLKAKTYDRVVLITDSIRGAGLPDGRYEHKGQIFTVTNGISRTPAGGLSGSTLSMDQAVRNALYFSGGKVEEVIAMATSVPAEIMGIANNKGKIANSYDADLVLLDKDFRVMKTIINGKSIYTRE